MGTEYQLAYTGQQIDERLAKLEGPLSMADGGTGSSALANAPDYAIFRKLSSTSDTQMWYTPTNKGAFYAKKENGEPVFGTLPLSIGGTGIDLSSIPPYALIRATSDLDDYPYLYYTATGNGAFYATEANGAGKFGTLPIAQGGTGATSAANARSNLGAAAKEHSHGASDISSGTLSSDRLPVVPMSKGGLGVGSDIVNAPANAILKRLKTDSYDQIYYTATGNGAFYATEANGAGKFGTLPVAQGGTGATSAAAALSNLGGISIKRLWNNEAPESSFAAQTLNIDLSPYTLVLVIALADASLGYRVSTIVPVGWSGLLTGAWGYSPEQGFNRKFVARSAGIEFYDAATNGVVTNTVLVPHRVYGIKGVTT